MKMCGNCGNQIDENLSVCPYCAQNKNVNESSSSVVETPVASTVPVVETQVASTVPAVETPVTPAVETSTTPVVETPVVPTAETPTVTSVENNGGNVLSDENIDKVVNVVDKAANFVRIIRLIPVIIIGFGIMAFGIFALIVGFVNGNKYKGEAVANFVELVNCEEYESDSGYCDAKYTYVVNNVSYEALEGFATEGYNPATITVHYNVDSPSDYVFGDVGISGGSIIMTIFGAIFFVVGILGIKNKNIKVSVGR